MNTANVRRLNSPKGRTKSVSTISYLIVCSFLCPWASWRVTEVLLLVLFDIHRLQLFLLVRYLRNRVLGHTTRPLVSFHDCKFLDVELKGVETFATMRNQWTWFFLYSSIYSFPCIYSSLPSSTSFRTLFLITGWHTNTREHIDINSDIVLTHRYHNGRFVSCEI